MKPGFPCFFSTYERLSFHAFRTRLLTEFTSCVPAPDARLFSTSYRGLNNSETLVLSGYICRRRRINSPAIPKQISANVDGLGIVYKLSVNRRIS